MSTASNSDQEEYWNRAGGERWVAHQEALDEMVRPFGQAALARLAPQPGEHVLDVGCGCGETLLEIGRSVGEQGSVTGIDLSVPMLGRARERAPFATLIAGDASTQPFARKFDALYSRFGVMFFSDLVGAFRHLAHSLSADGRLSFTCWRGATDNPWAALPVLAVRTVLPNAGLQGQYDPAAPGPFALAKRERLAEVLGAAGFQSVDIAPFDSDVVLSQTGLAAAVHFALTVGPGARLVADATPEERLRAEEALSRALEPHLHAGRVVLRGAAWTVFARRA